MLELEVIERWWGGAYCYLLGILVLWFGVVFFFAGLGVFCWFGFGFEVLGSVSRGCV